MGRNSARTKRKLRAAGRRGRAKQARQARRQRCFEVRRALQDGGTLMNVAELATATGRSAGVVRAALKEIEGVERVGTQYQLVPISVQLDAS